MKKLRFIIALILLSTQAFAVGDFGAGVMIGQPTGFTAKKILSNGQAVDAGAGWSIGGNTTFQLHSDYLWNKQDALYWNDKDPLDLYFGIGARMKFADEIELGLRAPVGMAYFMNERAVEVFTEIAPIFNFIPTSNVQLQLVVGGRIYF